MLLLIRKLSLSMCKSNMLKKRKLISEVPHIKRMKESKGRTRFLTDGEEEQLLCQFDHRSYQAKYNFTKFLLYTAGRGGEVLWAHIG